MRGFPCVCVGLFLELLTGAQWRIVLAHHARGELRDMAGSCDPDPVRAFCCRLVSICNQWRWMVAKHHPPLVTCVDEQSRCW